MKRCLKCHQSLEINARLCNNCGSEQPQDTNNENKPSSLIGDKNVISTSGGDIIRSKISGGNVSSNESINSADANSSGGKQVLGDKNVISTGGGDVVATKITGGNVNFTTVHEAQDDTKIRVKCFYTNTGVALEDIINCQSCKKDVAKFYYSFENNRCNHCEDDAKKEYTEILKDFLSDFKLDESEIQKLKIEQNRLKISEKDAQNIEKVEKEKIAIFKSSQISDKELNELDGIKKLFDLNKTVKHDDATIKVLYSKYPQLHEISFFYYLNEFEQNRSNLVETILNKREDNLFGYYFAGIAAILERKDDDSQAILEKLSIIFDEHHYLNVVLKTLALTVKFEYESNKLIDEKIEFLIQDITNSNIKGIHLSAYIGILYYINNYSCNGNYSKQISSNSDSISSAFGFFLINLREKALQAEERKAESKRQAERERIELEKFEKKKVEEKEKAAALKIEHDRYLAEEKLKAEIKIKEQERKDQLARENRFAREKRREENSKNIKEFLSSFFSKIKELWLISPKWVKGFLWFLLIVLIIRFFNSGDSYYEAEAKKEKVSLIKNIELEKIENKIIIGIENKEDKTVLLNYVSQLSHNDTESYIDGKKNGIIDPTDLDGDFFGTYAEYWNSKREAYTEIIRQNLTIDQYTKAKSIEKQNNIQSDNSIEKEVSENLDEVNSDVIDESTELEIDSALY